MNSEDRRAPLAADPCFQIVCRRGGLACSAGRSVPGGTRLQLVYESGVVSPLPGSIVPSLQGQVLSGADWVLIREDGVAVFDARLTLGKSPRDVVTNIDIPAGRRFEEGDATSEDFLLNAVISGRADLKLPRESGKLNYRDWLRHTGVIHLVAPMAFEAGQSATWAKPRFRQLGESFARYEVLVRRQCVAHGEVDVVEGQIVAARYRVLALNPGPYAGAA